MSAHDDQLGVTHLGYARVDTDRQARLGTPEVIFGEGKTPAQVVGIARALLESGANVLVTRASNDAVAALKAFDVRTEHHPVARCASIVSAAPPPCGQVGVLCAGTSDLPVAEEAAVTLQWLGAKVTRVNDVGVAGLHRVLAERDRLAAQDALIVVAGMDGALPSVVGGLVPVPVIAVPTSVGYGASLGGVAALLAMLNACAPGVVVVNIDNGFGAARAAYRMVATAVVRKAAG